MTDRPTPRSATRTPVPGARSPMRAPAGDAVRGLVRRACAASLLGVLALVLAACASSRIPDADRLALYRAHAGEPVPSFRLFGALTNWTPLGDTAVAVWPRASEAFLLEFGGPCPDIAYTRAITVTSTQGRVHARFDRVMALNRQSIRIPCHIAGIRPLDVPALRAAERGLREGGAQPAQVSGDSGDSGT